ncbi:MAG: DUF2079 domain-containing protein [Candidatus Auribacterota bacterium]|nr:DUF2079 domain-containing protein [Candidatus Auribacterota bacterium]
MTPNLRKLSYIFISAALLYLVIGVVLLVIFGPIKTDIIGVGFSHTSMTKPAKVCLILLLIGVFFRLRYSYQQRAGSLKKSLVLRRLILIALIWALLFTAFSLLLHYTYRSGTLDMAVHSQLLWNLTEGNFLQSSFVGYSFAANHLWLGLYLFIPIFLIGGEYALLVSEVIIIALGVFPVYFLTRDILKNHRWALSFALAYLLYPTLSMGVLFEFHLETITVPVIFTALLCLKRRRFLWFSLLVLLSIFLYEVTAVIFVFLGLALLFKPRFRLSGLILALISGVYLFIIMRMVMPYFGGEGYFPHWHHYSHLGSNPLEAFLTVLHHPLKIITESIKETRDIKNLLWNFQAVGFFPLLAPLYLIPAIPLTVSLFLSNWESQMDIRYSYIAPAIPFLFLAAIYGVRRIFSFPIGIGRWFRNYGMLLLLLSSGLLFIDFQLEYQIRGFPFPLRKNLDQIYAAASLIPLDASLSADLYLGSHFGRREIILLFPVTRYKKRPAEYIFLDLDEKVGKDKSYWSKTKALLKSDGWSPLYFSSGILLLKRGGEDNPDLNVAAEKYLYNIMRERAEQNAGTN